jgi:hypothetical protein
MGGRRGRYWRVGERERDCGSEKVRERKEGNEGGAGVEGGGGGGGWGGKM